MPDKVLDHSGNGSGGCAKLLPAHGDNHRSAEHVGNLAARLESAREDERRRISRDIHDELGQLLTAMRIDLCRIRTRLENGTPATALVPEIDSVAGLVGATMSAVHRIATDLRPRLLDDLGMIAAMEWHAREFQTRTGIRVRFRHPALDPDLPPDTSMALFRIFQELLTNVARHAEATTAEVKLGVNPDGAVLEIQDNGRGIKDVDLSRPDGLGLVGVRERAASLGGSLEFSGRPGQGARVTVRVPVNANSLS